MAARRRARSHGQRARRSILTQAFHRARRAEALTAWQAPNIQDWQTFVRNAWDERNLDGRIVLNSLQEQSLWARNCDRAAPELRESPAHAIVSHL
jgi:hypothetical protein